MRIDTARGNDRELVFRGDVAVVVRNRRRSVTGADGCSAQWYRLEVATARATKAAPERDGVALAGDKDEVVVAEFPYSQDWVQHAPFRRANHHGKSPQSEWRQLDPDQLIAEVEALPYDLFETKGRTLTAGISQPRVSFDLSKAGDAKADLHEVFGV